VSYTFKNNNLKRNLKQIQSLKQTTYMCFESEAEEQEIYENFIY
jgi:hypothetical protein